ncbi:MAG: sigma-70 family RNA polymerase sigma factor [Lentisphaerales bacterium]|nr:sigma-70 family RNA polymerase sigma factor [Lentisphaerales bacterium]
MNEDWKTRQTLLQRAKDPEDHQAWEEFVHYYRNFILMIMRKMNLSQSEQEDITQEILLKLWKKLESYNQQKAGFRTWLSAVIRNTVLKFYESSGRRLVRENKSFINFLEGDSESELETLIEEEWKSYLTKVALENIRKIFSGKAVQAFEMTLEEIPVEQICEELELKKESLYVLRNRVKSRFVEELRFLASELQF